MAGLVLAICVGLPGWACNVQQHTPVSGRLIHAICMVESQGNTLAYSPRDAGSPSYGVCQIKMKTAIWLGFKGDEFELMKPDVNAMYAAKYLQYHMHRYRTLDEAISAYNAGHATDSNQEYVMKVKQHMGVQ